MNGYFGPKVLQLFGMGESDGPGFVSRKEDKAADAAPPGILVKDSLQTLVSPSQAATLLCWEPNLMLNIMSSPQSPEKIARKEVGKSSGLAFMAI